MNSLQMPVEHQAKQSVFELIEEHQLETLHLTSNPEHSLQSVIAIHSTKLGPALGGCRCIDYDSESEAMIDAARLARGMSYKAALAGVPHGGGKAVILKPKQLDDRAALYRAFGEFVESLGGRYITAIDSGTSLSDMDQVSQITNYVAGSHRDGLDPSPITALGVFAGIKAAVETKLGIRDISGIRVAIQGLGNVGYALAQLLAKEGAELLVSDIDASKAARSVAEFGALEVHPDLISQQDCEVFAPCGLGGIINDYSYEKLRCQIVAGSANNQLAEDYHGKLLHENGVLYAPDYVINAGGLINVSFGNLGLNQSEIENKALKIGNTLSHIFKQSVAEDRPTSLIADAMAEDILNRA